MASAVDEARRARVLGTAAIYREPRRASRGVMYVLDVNGTIHYASDGVASALGCTQKAAIGSSLLARLDAASRRVLSGAISEVLRDSSRSTSCEIALDGADKLDCLVVATDPSGGAPTAFVTTWERPSARDEEGRRLRWVQSLTSATADVVLALGPQDERLFVCGSSLAMLGIGPEELTASRFLSLVHEADRDGVKECLTACRREARRSERIGFRVSRHDGVTRHVETHIHNRLNEPDVAALVLVTRDVGDRLVNPLTGLPNRAAFHCRLELAMARHVREIGRPYAVVLLSLDRFQLVEGGLGHAHGRELLVAVAERLRSCMRDDEVLAHVDREQFAVLVEGPGAGDRASALADSLQGAVEKPFQVGGRALATTASAGIAVGRSRHSSPEDVLRAAAMALHNAQRKGPSRNVMFETVMLNEVEAAVLLDYDLRTAVAKNELRLHYQPIVDLHTADIVGFEALLRWQHATRGFVSPAVFIPLAEENGLIGLIGQWVLRQACQQLAEWTRRCPAAADLIINVNVSAEQLNGPGLLDMFAQVIRETRVRPQSIKVEVTETSIVHSPESAAKTLRELRRRGFGLALDDFGTGYSSLAYLHSFPFDTIKIDKTFVQRLGPGSEHERDRALVRTILGLGKNLDMSVVAEGIETPEQFAMLRTLGCAYGQGFHIAKAMPEDEALNLVEAARRVRATPAAKQRNDTIEVKMVVD